MEAVILKLFNMSITASWLIAVTILLRIILKKAPKSIRCILWGFVAIRLICPVSFESILSLIPSTETISEKLLVGPSFDIDTGIEMIDVPVNDYLGSRYYEGVTVPTNAGMNTMQILSFIWLIGFVGMLLYTILGYVRIWKKVNEAIELDEGVWICDQISTPFILGVIHPQIYLPVGISEADLSYILAHEKAHIKRRDYLWKPIGFVLLAIYWFQPMVWLAYILFCRDIELACDEKVIHDMKLEDKKNYLNTLINCSASERVFTACPVAFGEVGVKDRIQNVLNYKKPAFWMSIAVIVICALVAVCFLTNPKEELRVEPGTYIVDEILYHNSNEYTTVEEIYRLSESYEFGIEFADTGRIHSLGTITQRDTDTYELVSEIVQKYLSEKAKEEYWLDEKRVNNIVDAYTPVEATYGGRYFLARTDNGDTLLVQCSNSALEIVCTLKSIQQNENSADSDKMQMTAKNITPTGVTLACRLDSEFDSGNVSIGSEYWLEKHTFWGWTKVPYVSGEDISVDWTMEAWKVTSKRTTEIVVNWEVLYGELDSGTYRIGKKILGLTGMLNSEFQVSYAEFTIE